MNNNPIKAVDVPKGFFSLRPERIRHTTFVQKPINGRFVGRTLVPRKMSDRTYILRMKRPYDSNHNGRIEFEVPVIKLVVELYNPVEL